LATALAIGTLPIAVIEPPLGTLLVPAIGTPPLLDSGLLTAGQATVTLPAITVRAEEK
jgi:hypothetical protein